MVNYVKMTSSDSWASMTCPYTLPAAYRPKLEINSALSTSNGQSVTSVLSVSTTGKITIRNLGGNGSTDARNGFICFPV